MDTTDFSAAAPSQPHHQDKHTSESSKPAHAAKVAGKPVKPARKSIRLGQLNLHPGFDEFASAIAKISFGLKDVGGIPLANWVKQISRREIKVVAADGHFRVVEGIRCWQVATAVLPPEARIEVTVLPACEEAEIYEALVDDLLVTQMTFRCSDAGAEQLVSLYGDFCRDPRFRPALQRLFLTPPNKTQFAGLLGLRSARINRKRIRDTAATPRGEDMTGRDVYGKGHQHDQ